MLTYSINPRVIGKSKQGHINAASGWTETTTSVFDLVEATAIRGQAMMPGLLTHSGKTKNHLHQFNTIVIDIDNSDGTGMTTWEQAKEMPFLRDNAVGMWTSTNHRYDDGDPETHYNGQDRYRILFRLRSEFRLCPAGNQHSYKKFHRIIKRLNELIPGADPNITPIHYFAGTFNGLVHIFKMGTNKLDVDELPELKQAITTRNQATSHNDNSFTGSTEDSLANVKTFLSHISSAEMETWLSVGGCLRNIGETIGEDVARELFLEWSAKDYAVKEGECEQFFDRIKPTTGGFGRLKQWAIDGGYEPRCSSIDEPFDPALFGVTDGFKLGDTSIIERPQPALFSNQDQAVLIDLQGRQRDLTYAKEKTIKVKDLLSTIEVITQDTKFRYNITNQSIERDGEEIPDDEMDIIHLRLSQIHDLNFPKETKNAIIEIALRDPFDPFVEELERIERDVKPLPIHNIASRYFKTTDPLHDKMMEKWLVGLVTKLMEPGTSIRGALVVKGKQFIGKDAFVNIICGDDARVMDVDGQSRLEDNNFKIALNQAWVANLDEVESITRSKVNGALKKWLTKTTDKIPVKFKMFAKDFPRRFSYYGSCNEAKFLQDPTGNTRWWVIETPLDYIERKERIDIEQLKQERDGIIAGAMKIYRDWKNGSGYQLELSDNELQQSERQNKGFVEDAAYIHILEPFLEDRTTTCAAELYSACDFTTGMMGQKNLTNEIARTYQQLGFESGSPRKLNGKSIRPIVKRGENPNLDELKSYLKAHDF